MAEWRDFLRIRRVQSVKDISEIIHDPSVLYSYLEGPDMDVGAIKYFYDLLRYFICKELPSWSKHIDCTVFEITFACHGLCRSAFARENNGEEKYYSVMKSLNFQQEPDQSVSKDHFYIRYPPRPPDDESSRVAVLPFSTRKRKERRRSIVHSSRYR